MKIKIKFLFASLLISSTVTAQHFYSTPFAHTFSIVARDSITGEMGVAVQSHWFSVGSIVGWGEAGVGVVATQSFVNPAYGPEGLKLLKEGKSPEEIINLLTAADSGRDVRQLAVLDVQGRAASYTGKKCIPPAGNIAGNNFSVQGNLLANGRVWFEMEKSFKESTGPLAERMIAALEAGQAIGGDIRGKQSASILVVAAQLSGKIWKDRKIDLRVEDNPEPIKELKRLLKIFRAYEHMNAGDVAVEKNDMQTAMREYSTAENMFPENIEMKFWHAVTLVNQKNLKDALPLFGEVFEKDPNWVFLIPRLRQAGHLICTNEEQKKIYKAHIKK